MAKSLTKSYQERYEMTVISAAQLHAIREKVYIHEFSAILLSPCRHSLSA